MTTPVSPYTSGFGQTVVIGGTAPTATGNQFPTNSITGQVTGGQGSAVYVPYEFTKNQGLNVPGLGTKGPLVTPPNSRGVQMGLPPGTRLPGSSVSLTQGLLNLLEGSAADSTVVVKLQKNLIKAGLLNPSSTTFTPGSVATGDATYYAYARLLNDAIETDTPYFKLLQKRINDPNNTVGSKWWLQYQQKTGQVPIDRTETSTSTDLTSGPDARAVAQQEYQSLLGRNVSDQEAQAFQGALNAYESAHPTTTTAQTEYDPQTGATNVRNSTSSGGITESGMQQVADSELYGQHGSEVAHAQGDQIYDLFARLIGG